MEKKRLFRIMSKVDREEIKKLSEKIREVCKVYVVKEPSKTLTMVKIREPVKSTLFYIGEIIVSEAIVEINKVKGIGVTIGGDLDKVLNMAIVDCAFNNNLPVTKEIEEELLKFEENILETMEKENSMHLKTTVDFNTMSGGDS